MAAAASLVMPVPCRRCKGRGFVDHMRVHAGAPGACFTCNGDGVVEGDKATLAAARTARVDAQQAARRFGQAAERLLAAGARDAHRGLLLLQEREPHRAAAAVAAVLADHPTVMQHLAEVAHNDPALVRLREMAARSRAERLARLGLTEADLAGSAAR